MRDKNKDWRPVAGFPGYLVSRYGQVWSLKRNKLLAQAKNRRGYCLVYLYAGGRAKCFLVSRLVAAAFLGPIPDGYEVNHKKGKDNNAAANLEIVTPEENRLDAMRRGLIRVGEDNPRARLTESSVRDIRRRHAAGETVRRLARELDLAEKTISLVVNRKTWKHVA